jgi:LysM repeat protein
VLDGLSSDADLTSDTDHLDLSWSATSTQYVSSFALGVGTTAGGYELSALADVGSVLSTTLNSLTLVDGQTYYATIVARNSINEPLFSATSDGLRIDSSAPDISVLALTAELTSADVSWTTNESATTLIEWGTTTDLGTTAVTSNTLSTSHTGTISGLTANTSYYARVTSSDEIGNTVQSEIISFTTSEATTTTDPEVATVGTPTLYTPVYRRSGNVVTLMITGITRNSSAVRLYVDSKLYSTYIIKSTSTVTSFAIALPLKNLKNGNHTYYVQSVGLNGEVGGKSRTVKFTVSGTTSAKRSRLSVATAYVVQRGDSLWSIARRFLGSGANYKQLVSQNSATFRSLLKNTTRINIGWILRIPGF